MATPATNNDGYKPVEAVVLQRRIHAIHENLITFVEDIDDESSFKTYIGIISPFIFDIYLIETMKTGVGVDNFHHIKSINLGELIGGVSDFNESVALNKGKWIEVQLENQKIGLLVLCTPRGTFFFDKVGSHLLFRETELTAEEGKYFSAISSYSNFVCLGTDRGVISRYEVVLDADENPKVIPRQGVLTTSSKIHGRRINFLACDCNVAVGVGSTPAHERLFLTIFYYQQNENNFVFYRDFFLQELQLQKTQCVTALVVTKELAILGCSNGSVCTVSLKDRKLGLISIIRTSESFLVSVDICVQPELLLNACSQNGSVVVFKMNLGIQNLDSTLVEEFRIKNSLLLCGRFLDPFGRYLAIASYSCKELYIYGSFKMDFP